MDYATYLDQLLLEAADAQIHDKIKLVNLELIHKFKYPDCPQTWLETAASEFARMGYGVDWQDTNNVTFRITGAGLLRAAEIRRKRAEQRSIGKMKAFIRKDWIALTAMIVSIFALFKDR